MSIIKGKTNIVAGFGGTKRPLGEVYFSQSSLASDNPGALPGWTGEYYENGKTLFPDLYNFVKAHSELQVTKAQYDSAITSYGECPKYVVDENGETTTETAYKFSDAEPSALINIVKTQTPQAGDILYLMDATANEPYDLSTATQKTIEAVTYSDAGALTSYTINGATMSVRGTVTAVSIITTTPGTSLRLPKRQTTGRYLVKKEVNGNNWYALYSDGWLEQGGVSTGQTVAFLKSFANANYTLTLGHEFGNSSDANVWLQFAKSGKTTTGFTYANATTPANTSINWEAKGYAAGTPMENIMYPWISAYTSAVPASTAQAAEFTGALSGKANTDLSNVLANIDYVVESQVNSDGSWYRKYKSGWLEQGGISSSVAGGATTTVTLPKPYSNTNYNVMVQPIGAYTASGEANNTIPTRTTTNFVIACGQGATQAFSWKTEGMGAN